MPKKSFTAEQMVSKLQQIEVLLAQGMGLAVACKEQASAIKATTAGGASMGA